MAQILCEAVTADGTGEDGRACVAGRLRSVWLAEAELPVVPLAACLGGPRGSDSAGAAGQVGP